MPIRTGLDQLPERVDMLRGRRIGLLAHAASFDVRLRHALEVVSSLGGVRLAALFGPEHGLRGAAGAEARVSDERDPRTGLLVHSLYGERSAPTPAQLHGIDVLVVDLQDVGVRFFTYYVTLVHCLRACATAGKAVLVLDRPNPRGGEDVDGPLMLERLASFVGLPGLPVQHGLTIGELARLVVQRERLDLDLTVLGLEGWTRRTRFARTGLPWCVPSPGLPTLETLTVYPGLALAEAVEASEGRGTTRPFELVGAPGVDPFSLADALRRAALPGVAWQPTWFVPAASKHAGVLCGGVQLHVTDRRAFRPLLVGLGLLQVARRVDPEAFAWRTPDADGVYWLDRLAGTDAVRLGLDAGRAPAELAASWDPERRRFRDERRGALLY